MVSAAAFCEFFVKEPVSTKTIFFLQEFVESLPLASSPVRWRFSFFFMCVLAGCNGKSRQCPFYDELHIRHGKANNLRSLRFKSVAGKFNQRLLCFRFAVFSQALDIDYLKVEQTHTHEALHKPVNPFRNA